MLFCCYRYCDHRDLTLLTPLSLPDSLPVSSAPRRAAAAPALAILPQWSRQARKMPCAVRCRLLVHPARAAAKCPVCIARPLADGRAETGAPHQLRKALTTEAKRYDLRIFGREGFALFHFFMCKPHQTFRNVHAHELPREGTEARDARTGFRRLSLWREQRRSGRRRLRHRKSVARGKSVSVRVDLGGRRIINKKKKSHKHAYIK